MSAVPAKAHYDHLETRTPKAREQALAEAKAQVEDLKKTLSENIVRTGEMQRQLQEAQDKERAALEQLNSAIRQAGELSARAEQARQKRSSQGAIRSA